MSTLKKTALVLGDIATLYIALIITLIIRYQSFFYFQLIENHVEPFTLVFAIWIIVFYIAGLYDFKSLKNNFDFEKNFWYTLIFNGTVTALFFYAIPYFLITPKTNLFIFIFIFGLLNYGWRKLYNVGLIKAGSEHNLLIVGSNKTAQDIVEHLTANPQFGYHIKFWMKDGLQDKEFEDFAQIIIANNITTIIIPAHLKKDTLSAKLIYKSLGLGIEVMDLSQLHEIVFHSVPLAELEEVWFLEHLVNRHRIYEQLNKPIEWIFALALVIGLSPLAALIALFIKTTSKGSVIFKQERIGKGGKPFIIYKFRTMYNDAEKDGPQWAHYDDERSTKVGSLLRRMHIDELPQLINILKGELSFVGPRPERPSFVKKLRKELPFYDLRHLTKPGITGWAQINYRYAASSLDAYRKLQYDIYYMKNNSPTLDLRIMLKTIKFLISNHV
ncbi:MAG: sugar transferase [bacterium]|nr:sugar transferase [bacterium]